MFFSKVYERIFFSFFDKPFKDCICLKNDIFELFFTSQYGCWEKKDKHTVTDLFVHVKAYRFIYRRMNTLQ